MGIFDSLKDTLQLAKNTFVIIGKNPAIIRPTLSQVLWAAFFSIAIFITAVIAFALNNSLGIIFALIAWVLIISFLLLFPFIKMYYRAAQCWIVYQTFIGNQATYQDGINRARQNKGDIFVLGLFDIILTALAKRLKSGSGNKGLFGVLISMLMWVVGKAVEEGWDLINHYLLPAAIIQEKNVIEVIPDIKNIKNNIPGALVGVFGFDFAGDLIKRYVTGFLIVIAILLGFLLQPLFHSWIPLLILIIIIICINSVLMIFVDMVKTIYFTLMYISLTMPKQIAPQYRNEVTNYLLKQNQSAAQPSNTLQQTQNIELPAQDTGLVFSSINVEDKKPKRKAKTKVKTKLKTKSKKK